MVDHTFNHDTEDTEDDEAGVLQTQDKSQLQNNFKASLSSIKRLDFRNRGKTYRSHPAVMPLMINERAVSEAVEPKSLLTT